MRLTEISDNTMIFTASDFNDKRSLLEKAADNSTEMVGDQIVAQFVSLFDTAVKFVGGYIPEIMMLVTVVFGAFIMISPALSDKGIGKPIGWWSAFMLGAVIWRIHS